MDMYLKKSELKVGSLYMKKDGGVYWFAGRRASGMCVFYKVHHFIVYEDAAREIRVPFYMAQHREIGSAITGILLASSVDAHLIYVTSQPKFVAVVPEMYVPNCCNASLTKTWLSKADAEIITAERAYLDRKKANDSQMRL